MAICYSITHFDLGKLNSKVTQSTETREADCLPAIIAEMRSGLFAKARNTSVCPLRVT